MNEKAGVASGPVLVAGALALGILGFVLYSTGVFDPETAVEESSDAEAVAVVQPAETSPDNTADQVAETASSTTDTEAAALQENVEAAEPLPMLPDAPSIDTFRLEPDGSMLIAGQADPDWATFVMLDGVELDQVSPDGAGKFVAFLTLDPSDQPRVLSLLMRHAEQAQELASLNEIIIAPTPEQPAPLAETVADAEPAPEPSVAGETVAAGATETSDLASAEASQPVASTPEPEEAAETATSDVPETSQEVAAVAEPIETTPEPATQASQTVLLSNAEGVQVLQPAVPTERAPDVMSTVALDAITYSQQGEVQLSGRGIGDGYVRVYLNNAPVITTQVTGDGNWRTELPEVDSGVYTLRIDETDSEGNVTSRVETPFKREDETLISEAQRAVEQQRITAVTVQPGSTLWAISRERYGEGTLYVRVFEANRDRIRDPDLIYPGQVFSLPE